MARVEEQVDQHESILDRVTDTLDRLVRFTVRHEETKKRVAENEERVGDALDEVADLRSYVESRWYVLATIVAVIVMAVEVITAVI